MISIEKKYIKLYVYYNIICNYMYALRVYILTDTYLTILTLFIVYLNIKLNWRCCILSGNPVHMGSSRP